MSEVLKIKIGVAVAFAVQLIYVTWFMATTLGEINQTFATSGQVATYQGREIAKLQHDVDKLKDQIRRTR